LLVTRNISDFAAFNGLQLLKWFASPWPHSKVGGIHANSSYPSDVLLENLKIQTHYAWCAIAKITGIKIRLTLDKTFERGRMDALLTPSSKGQLVIPARLSLEADGLHLVSDDREKPARLAP